MSAPSTSKPCRSLVQSAPIGDDVPYCCELPWGHEGPHVCGCGCGMKWGLGREGRWQGFDLAPGMLVRRRNTGPLGPGHGWIRRLVPAKASGHWDLIVHPSSSDHRPGDESVIWYGARDMPSAEVCECYTPWP